MCHICFMSTAMDSWSGFRGHAVIFRRASVPSQTPSQCFCPEGTRSPCLSVFFASIGGKNRQKAKVESNTTVYKRRERRNEEKAYYQQTDGPPFHSGPTGTWRDNSLHLRVRGAAVREGHLNTALCVCILFLNL